MERRLRVVAPGLAALHVDLAVGVQEVVELRGLVAGQRVVIALVTEHDPQRRDVLEVGQRVDAQIVDEVHRVALGEQRVADQGARGAARDGLRLPHDVSVGADELLHGEIVPGHEQPVRNLDANGVRADVRGVVGGRDERVRERVRRPDPVADRVGVGEVGRPLENGPLEEPHVRIGDRVVLGAEQRRLRGAVEHRGDGRRRDRVGLGLVQPLHRRAAEERREAEADGDLVDVVVVHLRRRGAADAEHVPRRLLTVDHGLAGQVPGLELVAEAGRDRRLSVVHRVDRETGRRRGVTVGGHDVPVRVVPREDAQLRVGALDRQAVLPLHRHQVLLLEHAGPEVLRGVQRRRLHAGLEVLFLREDVESDVLVRPQLVGVADAPVVLGRGRGAREVDRVEAEALQTALDEFEAREGLRPVQVDAARDDRVDVALVRLALRAAVRVALGDRALVVGLQAVGILVAAGGAALVEVPAATEDAQVGRAGVVVLALVLDRGRQVRITALAERVGRNVGVLAGRHVAGVDRAQVRVVALHAGVRKVDVAALQAVRVERRGGENALLERGAARNEIALVGGAGVLVGALRRVGAAVRVQLHASALARAAGLDRDALLDGARVGRRLDAVGGHGVRGAAVLLLEEGALVDVGVAAVVRAEVADVAL